MEPKKLLRALILGATVVIVAGCGVPSGSSASNANGSGEKTQQAYAPHINPSDFTTRLDYRYFPLKPGTTFVYEGRRKTPPSATR